MQVKKFIFDLLRPYYHTITYPIKLPYLRKNSDLKNKYLGNRCIILCSGKSVQQLDFSKIESEHVFACSTLFQKPEFNKIRNIKYFVLDSVRADYNHPDPYSNTANVHANYYAHLNQFLVNRPDIEIFLNAENISYFEKHGFYKNNHRRFIKGYRQILDAKYLSHDISGKFTFMDGVVYAMLASGLYMGFKEIYLIGSGYTYYPKQIGHFSDTVDELDRSPVDCRHTIINNYLQTHGTHVFNVVPVNFTSPVYKGVSFEKFYEVLKAPYQAT
jgi:hypothetical protein